MPHIDVLLSQMCFYEIPKRAQFGVGLVLGDALVIDVKSWVVDYFSFALSALSLSPGWARQIESVGWRELPRMDKKLIVFVFLLQTRTGHRTEQRRP